MKNKVFIIMLMGVLLCIAIFTGVFIGRSSIGDMVIVRRESDTSPETVPKAEPFHINEVSEDELVIYLQIRRSLAREIVNYRKTYGDFVYLSELKKVPGMSDEVYEQIRPYLTVSDE